MPAATPSVRSRPHLASARQLAGRHGLHAARVTICARALGGRRALLRWAVCVQLHGCQAAAGGLLRTLSSWGCRVIALVRLACGRSRDSSSVRDRPT